MICDRCNTPIDRYGECYCSNNNRLSMFERKQKNYEREEQNEHIIRIDRPIFTVT